MVTKIESAAEMITNYLKAHPNAADTIDGIVSWWLTRQQYAESRDIVEKALELLVQRDCVDVVELHGKTFYSKKTHGLGD